MTDSALKKSEDSLEKTVLPFPKKSETTAFSKKPAVLGGTSTTAKTEKPAVSRAAAIAVPGQSSDFAGPVLTVSLSALCTAPSPVQNLHKLLIPVMAVRTETGAHWKRLIIMLTKLRRNTKKSGLNQGKASISLKKNWIA